MEKVYIVFYDSPEEGIMLYHIASSDKKAREYIRQHPDISYLEFMEVEVDSYKDIF